MSSAPLGRWVVVRSDRLLLSVDKADHLYHVGRSRQLPYSQVLLHKYASREQLAVVWQPPHLYVAQMGKNPSFLGPTCDAVPPLRTTGGGAAAGEEATPAPANAPTAAAVSQHALLRFTPSASVKEATLQKGDEGFLEVLVPLSDPLVVTQAPDRHDVSAATIYFPDELGLPSLTVRFESADVSAREDATAAATTKTAAEMLAVPTLRKAETDEDNDGSDDEDDVKARRSAASALAAAAAGSEGTAHAEAREKPEWRGLLDVALQEQQRQDATRVSGGHRGEAAVPPRPSQTAATEVAAAPPAPSVAVPFGGSSPSKSAPAPASSPAPVAPVAAAAAAAAAAPHHKMGFWEWNNHVDGNQDDPKSWRKYNQAVAALLEKAYCDTSVAKVKIPDSAMFDKPGAKGATYGVCFAEKALKGAMIQYSLEDPGRFRLVRRTGGSTVDRRKAKKAHVIPSSSESESESEDSFSDDDSDSDSASDSDSEESVSSSSSSESDEKPKKKKRRN